jgi:hypothetical protein
MTLTLELSPEQEAKLLEKAKAAGKEPADYVLDIIEQANDSERLSDRLRRLGVLGSVTSTPRPDSKPWSEVEGLE